jgi:hypothetical protein
MKSKKQEFASTSGSVRPVTQCRETWASPEISLRRTKINLIKADLGRISEIKLKRTDTTLDLSQKALEKQSARWFSSIWGGKGAYKEAGEEKRKRKKRCGKLCFYTHQQGASG